MLPHLPFIILLSFVQFKSSLMKSSQTIILIRHGEKISDDYMDLSPEGRARANCLPELFTKDRLGYVPTKIYANKRSHSSTRPYDTVVPLSKALGLQIEEFQKSSSKKLKDIFKKYSDKKTIDFVKNTLLKDEHNIILVCSSHLNIPIISELLGRKVDVSGNEASVYLSINIKFGYSIPDISVKVQNKVKSAIENMTGIKVTNVHISYAGVAVEA